MRLMNTASQVPYYHPSECYPDFLPLPADAKKGAKPEPHPQAGEPMPGATKWLLRALTSREDGALQDSLYDMSRAQARANKANPDEAVVDMNMSISPSEHRRNRVRLGVVGWEGLEVEDNENAGKFVPLEYKSEKIKIGTKEFDGAPASAIDLMPQDLVNALAEKISSLSSMTPTEGNA